jgi:hypothetical protein
MECRHFPDPNRRNNRLENLSWGTPAENAADKIGHGTHNRGERHPLARLSEVDVTRMHDLWESGQHSQAELAGLFRVSKMMASLILRGKRWRQVWLARHQVRT